MGERGEEDPSGGHEESEGGFRTDLRAIVGLEWAVQFARDGTVPKRGEYPWTHHLLRLEKMVDHQRETQLHAARVYAQRHIRRRIEQGGFDWRGTLNFEWESPGESVEASDVREKVRIARSWFEREILPSKRPDWDWLSIPGVGLVSVQPTEVIPVEEKEQLVGASFVERRKGYVDVKGTVLEAIDDGNHWVAFEGQSRKYRRRNDKLRVLVAESGESAEPSLPADPTRGRVGEVVCEYRAPLDERDDPFLYYALRVLEALGGWRRRVERLVDGEIFETSVEPGPADPDVARTYCAGDRLPRGPRVLDHLMRRVAAAHTVDVADLVGPILFHDFPLDARGNRVCDAAVIGAAFDKLDASFKPNNLKRRFLFTSGLQPRPSELRDSVEHVHVRIDLDLMRPLPLMKIRPALCWTATR